MPKAAEKKHGKKQNAPNKRSSFELRSLFSISQLSLNQVLVLFGVLWLILAELVYLVERNAEGSNIKSFDDSLWWGVVTFLTVGYGDRFPVTVAGRALALILMFAGVFVISLLTATISSAFFEAALNRRRREVNKDSLNQHFVICGFTDDMDDLLLHILDFNPNLPGSQVVVIANFTENHRSAILSNPKLQDIQFIQGDYFTELNLRRAAPERAKKVLILADRTPNAAGVSPTLVEVDARTIMTAMSLSKIKKGIMVAAEILDPKMDEYLKIAGVNEIIYSREYSRLLLGNASSGTGVVNILYDLLDPRTSARITTQHVPKHLIGKSYRDIKNHFQEQEIDVIGVLENFGNQHFIKEGALRKAQQTPDIHQLVSNLKAVREIKCNNPVFNPRGDYVVREDAMMIVIENVNSHNLEHNP